MDTLETQAFNEWLAHLKAKTIQPTLVETQCFIALNHLAISIADINALAESWLTLAVEKKVLVVNPHPHPYQLREGN